MSSDFADMLKDTLSKMQDRIEFANGKGMDDDGGNAIQQQFDHLTNVKWTGLDGRPQVYVSILYNNFV